MYRVLTEGHTVVDQYFRELRDISIQQDRMRFETNIERIGLIAAYELSKDFAYKTLRIKTPLDSTESHVLKNHLVIAAVLRAGLPVQRGILRVFDYAEQAFVTAQRHGLPTKTGFDIEISYTATPPLAGKILILADTMIATGNTLIKVYNELIKRGGIPLRTCIIGIIASKPAIQTLQIRFPDASIIVGAIDPYLNNDFLIIPGLGDAGDLLFGKKDS